MNKEKQLNIELLIEKLQRITGKKVMLEDNLFSNIDTPESLKQEIIKEKQADIQTIQDLLKQYSIEIKVDNINKITGRATGRDLYLISWVVIDAKTNEVYEKVFKSVTDLETFLKPKVLASRIQCSNTKGIKPGITIGLEYKKLITTNKTKLTEETKEQWEVIFIDCGDDEVVVNEKFNSEEEAIDWAEDKEYDYQDEYYNGEDYVFKTFYKFYNPEDKQSSYVSYEVRPVTESNKQELTEAKEKKQIVEVKGEFKSVVSIILMGDYVLLGKALSKDDRNGKLVFPGGGIEEGETLEQACKREVMEETNLFIKVRKTKSIVLEDLPSVVFLICDYSYGEINFNEEYSESGGGWYHLSKEHLPWNKIYSKNIQILKDLIKNK